MDDIEFLQRADAAMSAILTVLDGIDPDEVDTDLAAGVLTMEFADGKKSVMNRQGGAHQIWLAEGATAWHFAWDEATSQWRDTKGRGALEEVLGRVLSSRLGRAITLKP